jgi:hypothetical protein
MQLRGAQEKHREEPASATSTAYICNRVHSGKLASVFKHHSAGIEAGVQLGGMKEQYRAEPARVTSTACSMGN